VYWQCRQAKYPKFLAKKGRVKHCGCLIPLIIISVTGECALLSLYESEQYCCCGIVMMVDGGAVRQVEKSVYVSMGSELEEKK